MKAKQELVSYSLNTGLLLPTSKSIYRYAKYLTSRASAELIFAPNVIVVVPRDVETVYSESSLGDEATFF